MNIFKGKDRICGTFSLERLKAADRTFWLVAKEVDNALGDMNHLLNNYLANIMHQINTYTVSEVAEQGLDDYTEFVCLCNDVANEKKMARNKNVYQSPKFHGFYPEVKHYRDKHPEQCEKRNISSVLLWINGLFCKFTDYAMKYLFHKTNTQTSKNIDLESMDECYQQMANIVGENLMERLNNAIVERFIKVSLSDIYLQSTINNYIDYLTQQDDLTSKYIFRVILDGMKNRGE